MTADPVEAVGLDVRTLPEDQLPETPIDAAAVRTLEEARARVVVAALQHSAAATWLDLMPQDPHASSSVDQAAEGLDFALASYADALRWVPAPDQPVMRRTRELTRLARRVRRLGPERQPEPAPVPVPEEVRRRPAV